MKVSLTTLLCFLSLSFPALQSIAAPQDNPTSSDRLSNSQEGNGILIDGETYAELQNLPGELMSNAEKAFDAKNLSEASSDLQTAARILRLSSINNDNSQSRREMRSAAEGLDHVARKIRFGEIADSQQLLKSLAQAMYYKSDYDRLRAVDAWTLKQAMRAGYDLKASANEIEKASNWSGRILERGGKDAIQGARDVAAKLTKGADWSAEEVGRALEHLGVTIKTVGDSITPSGKTAVQPSKTTDVPASHQHSK